MNTSDIHPYSIEVFDGPGHGEDLYFIYRNNKPCNGYQRKGFISKKDAEEEIGMLLAEDKADAYYDNIDME